ISIEGRGDFTLQASGTPDSPAINADVQLRDLTLDRELIGALDLKAVTNGRELRLDGHSNFQKGSLAFDGTVQLHDDYPANLSVRTEHLDVDALLNSYLQGKITGHSSVGGTLTMQGPLRNPRKWALNGNLTDVFLDVDYAKLHNQDPIRFTYGEQSLRVDQL